jgi:hypothetical protein
MLCKAQTYDTVRDKSNIVGIHTTTLSFDNEVMSLALLSCDVTYLRTDFKTVGQIDIADRI